MVSDLAGPGRVDTRAVVTGVDLDHDLRGGASEGVRKPVGTGDGVDPDPEADAAGQDP